MDIRVFTVFLASCMFSSLRGAHFIQAMFGKNKLLEAVKNEEPLGVIEQMFARGANPLVTDKKGNNLIAIALDQEESKINKLGASRGEREQIQNFYDKGTALSPSIALRVAPIQERTKRLTELVLNAAQQRSPQDTYKLVNLPRAEALLNKAMRKNEGVARLLVGFMDGPRSTDGITPLVRAILDRDQERAIRLLELGADLQGSDIRMGRYFKPLTRAIARNLDKVVELLIEKGVDVNSGFFDGTRVWLPLELLMTKGKERLAKKAIEAGADVKKVREKLESNPQLLQNLDQIIAQMYRLPAEKALLASQADLQRDIAGLITETAYGEPPTKEEILAAPQLDLDNAEFLLRRVYQDDQVVAEKLYTEFVLPYIEGHPEQQDAVLRMWGEKEAARSK